MCIEEKPTGAHLQMKLQLDIRRANQIGVDPEGRIVDLSYKSQLFTNHPPIMSSLLRLIKERQVIAERLVKKEYGNESDLIALEEMFKFYNEKIKKELGL